MSTGLVMVTRGHGTASVTVNISSFFSHVLENQKTLGNSVSSFFGMIPPSLDFWFGDSRNLFHQQVSHIEKSDSQFVGPVPFGASN